MIVGLIKEGKRPADNRVALTPPQCKWLHQHIPNIKIIAQSSSIRCFTDEEYKRAGVEITDNIAQCDILLGIKEVPVEMLIPNKTYLFFSHTRKQQPHNKKLLKAIIEKNITLIDYECLEHEDGQRIIGFGFFAGVVGAHNGIMAYGNRTNLFDLPRVYKNKDYRSLINHYFGLKLPNVKIAVTGSGRVAHGVIEVMNLMGVHEVEPDEYLEKKYTYPVYVQLKGAELYTHKETKTYKREHFHNNPQEYRSRFLPYTRCTDILMNGVYWDNSIPRLFETTDIDERFVIQTISDITDDENGSVPINLGDQTIEDPVYGVDRNSLKKSAPYKENSIDIVAVGNLPNELPRDASKYFGEQMIKYILNDLLEGGSKIIEGATIVHQGKLTTKFAYLENYAK
ncbi:MAG: alanine dehydrogenase [Chitinophagaceae bacterium]|nr:alanine dehydrogenase [Chitinophagaceae bacterium]MCW5905540.1 alanine dehydrogenase [Chitinophagaceae bacterium]